LCDGLRSDHIKYENKEEQACNECFGFSVSHYFLMRSGFLNIVY
jgi:hypothetical protein